MADDRLRQAIGKVTSITCNGEQYPNQIYILVYSSNGCYTQVFLDFSDVKAAAFLSVGCASLLTGQEVLVQFIGSEHAQLVCMSMPPPNPVDPHTL